MASTVFVNGVTLTAAAWFQDVDNIAYQYLSGVAGTNTITATGPSGLGAYAAGLKFRFIPANTNTGATTINITGTVALGARNIFFGGAALVGGELGAGIPVEIIDDGTRFSLFTAAPAGFTSAETAITGAGTTVVVAHGLGSVPRSVFVVIRCKTAEFGFSIGDEVAVEASNLISVYSDVTNVGIVVGGSAGVQVIRRDTFATTAITVGNWKYIVRAYK